MKKTVVSMLAAALMFVPLGAVHAEFSDVTPEYPYYDAIMYVQEQGIVEGYSDGTFRPDNKINRAEFTKILIEAAVGTPEASISKNCFTDVQDQWFYVYVCFAKGKGWIGGYADGSFKPDQAINFAEAAKIIVNTMIARTAAGNPWYKPYVDTLYSKYAIPNTIAGFGDQLTRGEMAEIIYRLKAGVKQQSKSYDELDQAAWVTYTSTAVPFEIKYPADYSVQNDTAETVNMDRQLQAVRFSKDNTCPPNYEGYCMEKYYTVRVFNNQGSQTLDQFVDLSERYDNWEIRAYDLWVDGQSARLLYPSETELYARRFVFAHGAKVGPDIYQYFFEIELSSGIDEEQQYEILQTFEYGEKAGDNETLTYLNDDLSLSFDYPAEWGSLLVHEFGAQGGGVDMITLKSSVNEGYFMVADNPENDSEGRGGAWFDKVRAIDSADDVENFCKSTSALCEVFVNRNGVTIAKVWEEGFQWGDDVLYPAMWNYYMYNPNSEFSSILISATEIIYFTTDNANIAGFQDQVDELVQTIDFY